MGISYKSSSSSGSVDWTAVYNVNFWKNETSITLQVSILILFRIVINASKVSIDEFFTCIPPFLFRELLNLLTYKLTDGHQC